MRHTATPDDEIALGAGRVKWLHVIIGAYGTIFPLLAMRMRSDSRYHEAVSWLVPHFTLVPYFFATLAWRIQANVWKPPKKLYFVITEYSEVLELVLAVAFFMFLLFQWRRFGLHPTA